MKKLRRRFENSCTNTAIGPRPLLLGAGWSVWPPMARFTPSELSSVTQQVSSLERQHRNTQRLQLRGIRDLSVIKVLDAGVRHEVELAIQDGSGRGIADHFGPALENLTRFHLASIWRQLPAHHAIGRSSIFNSDQTALVPVQAVNSCHRVMRSGLNILRLVGAQIHANHTQIVADVEHIAILGNRDTVGPE